MAKKHKKGKLKRRDFLKKVTAGGALAGTLGSLAPAEEQAPTSRGTLEARDAATGPAGFGTRITYPRVFVGGNLKMIAFPLGGIGTGSIALSGRGQLCDWEIFNRPDKGNVPDYCFPAIWAKAEGSDSVARVLEARLQPPYEK